MAALFKILAKANIGALVVLIIIFAALLAGGANDAARAALLSTLLLACLAVASVVAPRRALARLIGANWLSLASLLLLSTLAALSTLPIAQNLVPAPPPWNAIGEGPHPLSLSPYRTWEGLIALWGPAVAFGLGALLSSERAGRDQISAWGVALGLAFICVAISGFFSGAGAANGRMSASLGSPNVAAIAFALLGLLAMTRAWRAGRGKLDGEASGVGLPRRLRWLGFAYRAPLSTALLALALVALMLTASRAGLIVAALAFAGFILMNALGGGQSAGRRVSAIAAPLAIAAVLAALLLWRGGDMFFERLALVETELERRDLIVAQHWRYFLERPWTGWGLNSFHELNTMALGPETWRTLGAQGAVHNIYVQTLAETGLVGLALWVLMLAPPILRAGARILGGKAGLEWSALALCASLLFLAHGLVDFALQVPALAALYGFLLGAAPTNPR